MTLRYFAAVALSAFAATAALAEDASSGGASSPASAKPDSAAPATTVVTAPAPHRPQEESIAAASLPYRVEQVAFDNAAVPGVHLSATLTLPNGTGPFPAAVLVGGSGRHAREEEFGNGHKPMLVLADALTKAGYAVLRYDKRGVGQSTGPYDTATTMDFASDAEAAVQYMRSRADIDAKRLGLVGHSEGSNISAIVAGRDPHVAFVVMLAANALPGTSLVAVQTQRMAAADGDTTEGSAQATVTNTRFFEAITQAKDQADAQARVQALAADPALKATSIEIKQAQLYARLPYMRFILAYDPRPDLRALRVPVLELHGSKDLIGPTDLEVPALREALAQDPDATIVELPGLNHFFQHAATGSRKEFGTIEETIAPEAIDTILNWLARHTK